MAGSSNKKPAFIILDEVDGTHESESKGAIKALLSYIYDGKKGSDGGIPGSKHIKYFLSMPSEKFSYE